jgi:hypothetical protein
MTDRRRSMLQGYADVHALERDAATERHARTIQAGETDRRDRRRPCQDRRTTTKLKPFPITALS